VIVIPSAALTAGTVISAEPITNEAPDGLGGGFRLTPAGQAFAEPVELVFSYADLDLEGTQAEALGIATQTSEATWQSFEV